MHNTVRLLREKFSRGLYVPVSHQELDDLIGRLMQMCELTGDLEQRRALKSEIKLRTRGWLDNIYAEAGYRDMNTIDESDIQEFSNPAQRAN